MDDLERVFDNSDCHELLAVVPSVHHQGVNETLNNGALSLAETLGSISSSRVGKVLGILLLDCNVILEGHVGDLNILAAPLSNSLISGSSAITVAGASSIGASWGSSDQSSAIVDF